VRDCRFDQVRFRDLRVWRTKVRSSSYRGAKLADAVLGGWDDGEGNDYMDAEVAERLGHDPATLRRYYTRIHATRRRRQAATSIADLIEPTPPTTETSPNDTPATPHDDPQHRKTTTTAPRRAAGAAQLHNPFTRLVYTSSDLHERVRACR
jgi:hypothetical protein